MAQLRKQGIHSTPLLEYGPPVYRVIPTRRSAHAIRLVILGGDVAVSCECLRSRGKGMPAVYLDCDKTMSPSRARGAYERHLVASARGFII